ncbi:MAG TPA: vWA domain-containing protein [Thermoanaerobaculia bacterium]|nr:vWA domain-containing protein [Thermoanaerobaculia bacterium]
MAIIIRVNGNSSSGQGFLVVSAGGEDFPVPVGLRTDDGTTVNATLHIAAGGVAALVFSQTNVTISPVETFVQVHATSPSTTRNDTSLEVRVGGVPQATFQLTAVSNPKIVFLGRFQARFATAGDPYNHPTGTAAGWTWSLPGEPNFVPADSVADSPTKPVGRVIRFNNPVFLRSQCPPVTTAVTAIRAQVGAATEDFTAGDSILGLPVNLGPNTYFAGNQPVTAGDPAPFEQNGDAAEPMAIFEVRVGNLFSGGSDTLLNRPKPISGPAGSGSLTAADFAAYGLPGTFTAYRNIRRPALQTEFGNLTAAQQAAQIGLNLQTRIDKITTPTAIEQSLFSFWLLFSGKVNDSITFAPTDSPTLRYFARFSSFTFRSKLLNFRVDDLGGVVDGSIEADVAQLLPPLPLGIYNITTTDSAAFNALNAPGMTEANIDAALGGAPANDRVVITVGSDYDRLVVSRVVVANPADPPNLWTITSRGASYVFDFQPVASVFPRDLTYLVLPPGHERNQLGNCEGTFPVPAPAVGFARLFYDGNEWKLLLHVGTVGGAGTTMKGTWSGSPATIAPACTPADLELLTPLIDFGSIEQGLIAHRQIALLNRSANPIDVTLPALAAPFGAVGASTVQIQPGEIGTIGVSFTAGAPGASGPVAATLTSIPVVPGTLTVNFVGTSLVLAAVDTVLVLDRSGSMAEPALSGGGRVISKTDLRNSAVQVFIDLLRDGDRVGMVRFDNAAQPHMPLEAAGVPVTGSGRVNATTALASPDLLPGGATAVGDGLVKGDLMLAGPTASLRKALVVLTDGVENRPPFINTVTLAAGVRAYAIGLGQPQNVNVDKLSAITGNTGGYLLVTGELDAANEFRLHKYFTQILAGIDGGSIVVDPRSVIQPGEAQRTPFYVTEADAEWDAVLLDRFPMLEFRLEMPDGTAIDPAGAAAFGGLFVQGRACRYYRMRTGLFPDPARARGKWHMVVEYPGEKIYRGQFAAKPVATHNVDDKRPRPAPPRLDVSYNVIVRARSAIRLDSRIDQRSVDPGSPRTIVAHLSAFQQPFDAGVSLVAQVTRPDGVVVFVPLQRKAAGRFEAPLEEKQLGHYDVVVRAAGTTPGGFTLQREQTMSAAIIDPAVLPTVDSDAEQTKATLEEQRELIEQLVDALQKLPSQLKWWLIALLILLFIIALALIF